MENTIHRETVNQQEKEVQQETVNQQEKTNQQEKEVQREKANQQDKTIQQIYDKVFKKMLTLSSKAVINMINGLFETHYPTDSTVTYNWTEFEDKELKRILADTIITIADKYSYHMEAQMTKDDDIVLRVFEYGFHHAYQNSWKEDGIHILNFPEVRVIYLYAGKNLPREYSLYLDFGTLGSFLYKAPVIRLQEISTEEMNQRKLVILIPFSLLRLRDSIRKERTSENLNALKNLIKHDILGSIEKNLELGNISMNDARKLKRLTHQLYQHIYAHYEEIIREGINDMTDESMMLDIDIIEKEHEREIKKILDEKENEIREKDAELEAIKEMKDAEVEAKDAKIAELKKRLEELKKQ